MQSIRIVGETKIQGDNASKSFIIHISEKSTVEKKSLFLNFQTIFWLTCATGRALL